MENSNILLKDLHLNGKANLPNQFYADVVHGLQASPKQLDSKYFYDAAGDKLFREIMECPEYYPTNCELEIFSSQTAAICNTLVAGGEEFELIELGAGDATKSSFLLRHLMDQQVDFTYLPIDISENIINYLNLTLPVELPGIKIEGLNGEYFQMLQKAAAMSDKRKVVLFLGSNIGNMELSKAQDFCIEMRRHLSPGDLVLIGFDLKKNPKTVLAAYNDKEGITKRFNLNLLTRINRELNADFNIEQFDHYPTYNPETGECKSYLISLAQQDVSIGTQVFHFEKDEYIDMEISQKFTLQETERIAANAGFKAIASFFDKQNWFLDAIWMAE
jgi:dimethylhistidine N-methyltransferase